VEKAALSDLRSADRRVDFWTISLSIAVSRWVNPALTLMLF
jgi:hypothetical protein